MSIRRDLLFGIATLVALQLLTSFAAIGVLTRMSPAIERILQENDASIGAAEEVLAALAASAGAPAGEVERQRIDAALERIRRNVTEPEELGPIAELDAHLGAALAGERAAAGASVAALRRLVRINREAMREADDEAKRLGAAGAWSAVSLAMVAFLLSLHVARRVSRRLLAPLLELDRVLEAARAGNPHRRCQPMDSAPDVRRVLEGVNRLLDARMEAPAPDTAESHRAVRAALLHLLDAAGGARFVVDARGEVAAASRQGLERLAEEDGEALRRELAALAGAPGRLGLEAVPLGDRGWLAAAADRDRT